MSRNVKVGIFVAAGILVASLLIFLIGDERHLFDRAVELRASFNDVGGLRVGGPVRMGGVDVGQVVAIEFGQQEADRRIHIRFTLVARELVRVRRDSVVRIASKGLLGDKALDLTMGSAREPGLRENDIVRSEESDDMGTAIRSAGTALQRANEVLGNVVAVTRPLANDRLGNDLLAIARDVRTITHQIAEGPGTAHALLADPMMAQRIESTLASVNVTAQRVAAASGHVEAIAREARSGRGLVHALVYDRQGGEAVRNVAEMTQEIAAITRDVRTGDGGLHRVIYGREASEALANVNAASASLRNVMQGVEQGRGTVGALLVDPSLYEDLKSLVGNVQRNEILRALVRYSIHADEGSRQPTPAATPAAPTSR
jgi:phospholipid/cholesterol/gamma-HCH transport system substrate-binding protein